MNNSTWNLRAALPATLLAVAVFSGNTASAQYYPPAGGNDAASASQGPVIQIHHHHYYYQPSGLKPLVAQQADPAVAGGPGYFGPRPNGDAPTDFGGSWGGLGFYGYLGQEGDYAGLIVSRVSPNSPAAQLGLVAGDIILEINDRNINDLTTRQLQILLLGLTTQEEEAVSMQVWNMHTRRGETLKGTFEDKEVGAFQKETLDDGEE